MASARTVRGFNCDDPLRSTAGKVLWTRFEEMMSFSEAALAGRDAEGVHDMRVASRRLRAAMEAFAEIFPRRRYGALLREVKQIADALGQVRDLDVMVDNLESERPSRTEPQQIVLDQMIADMREERDVARRLLHTELEELERSGFPRRFLAFVATETV